MLERFGETRDCGALDFYLVFYGEDPVLAVVEMMRISGKPPMLPRHLLGLQWTLADPLLDQAVVMREIEGLREYGAEPATVILGSAWADQLRGDWNTSKFPAVEELSAALHLTGCALGVAATRVLPKADGDTPAPLARSDPGLVDVWWVPPGTPFAVEDLLLLRADTRWEKRRRSQRQRQEHTALVIAPLLGLGSHRYSIACPAHPVESTWPALASIALQMVTKAAFGALHFHAECGGFVGGTGDGELLVRWAQLALLGPIMRVSWAHAPFESRHPKDYDRNTQSSLRRAFSLRKRFVPYLFSTAFEAHSNSVPLLRPVYFRFPYEEESFHCEDQFFLGSQILVAPFLSPADEHTRMASRKVWFPRSNVW